MTLEFHTDAATAVSTALRDLAQENPTVDAPERVSPTLGEMLSSARTFSHVLDHLARTLRTHGARARDDDDDASVGAREVTTAAAALSTAAGFLSRQSARSTSLPSTPAASRGRPESRRRAGSASSSSKARKPTRC